MSEIRRQQIGTFYYAAGNLTLFPICPATKNFGIHDSTITWHVV